MVSKAFQVLSGTPFYLLHEYVFLLSSQDPQKRSIFDRSGSDPDDRTSGMSSAGPSNFRASSFGGGGGQRFDGEISPEDLFNMFFGGGGGGGFGGGGGGFGGFGDGPGKLLQTVLRSYT